jgi:hypothetical protein
MGKDVKKTAQPAEKTIEAVFKEFLDEQKKHLKPSTMRNYEDIIELFTASLDGYAYQYLDKTENTLFNRLYNAKGKEQREFCQIFGPEKIPDSVSEFLNYYMVHKVICGKELKKAAGTVLKKLGQWLLEKGYLEPDAAGDMVDDGAAAAIALPATEELAKMLGAYAEQNAVECDDVFEDRFTIEAVKPGQLRLCGLIMDVNATVSVPRMISNACRAGWSISGTLGKSGRRWHILEVWNIYP